MRMIPRGHSMLLYQPTQVRAGKEPVARRSVWPSCSAIDSIRLSNPINHSNHSTPSTINMFLFYLLVHDRTQWQDWTIGWIDRIEWLNCMPGPPGRCAAESRQKKIAPLTHILQETQYLYLATV